MICVSFTSLFNFLLIFILSAHVSANVPPPQGPAVFNGESWVSVSNDVSKAGEPRPPTPILSHTDPNQSEIFVGILSYRDPRCGETLNSLFKRAKYPDRVRIGLVQERSHNDMECIKTYCQSTGYDLKKCPHINQITTVTQSQFETKSYSRGRSMVFELLKDEEFCLTTEAFVEVVQNWDVEMIQMWLNAENEYGVLSVYPAVSTSVIEDTVKYSVSNANTVPHMCQASYYSTSGLHLAPELSYSEAQGVIENLPPRTAVNLQKPLLTSLYSGSFSFAKCHLERKVPWDPFNENIDKGDDFMRYARLWTRGYDVYTPNKVLLVINNRNVPKLVGSKSPDAKEKDLYDPVAFVRNGMTPLLRRQHKEEAIARMNLLLGNRKSFWSQADNSYNMVAADGLLQLTRYGLGYKRTLDQLIDYTGVDTRSRLVFADRCKSMSWVPFTTDEDPNTDESDPWASAPEKLVSSAIPSSGDALGLVRTRNSHSAAFNKIIHGSPLPLLREGKKEHISSVLITDKQQREALERQQAAAAAAAKGAEEETRAAVEPAAPEVTTPPVPPSPVVSMWKSSLGWWFDDWMTLVQTLLMLTLPGQVGTKENTTKIIKIMLLLFPVVLCVILGSLSLLSEDEAEGDGSGAEEGVTGGDKAEGVGIYGSPKKLDLEDGNQTRSPAKKKAVGTPSSTKKKQQQAPSTPVKRVSPKSNRNN